MYIDLNVSFASDSNEYIYVEDTKDIIKSLERLFNTRQGSVPFNRSYGSSLWSLLFRAGRMIVRYSLAGLETGRLARHGGADRHDCSYGHSGRMHVSSFCLTPGHLALRT